MPVKKYRDIGQMPPTYRRPHDPDNLRLALELSAACLWLARAKYPPGVHRRRDPQRHADPQLEPGDQA